MQYTEFEERIQNYINLVKQIKVPADVNPGVARNLLAKISMLVPDVLLDYHKLKSMLSNMDVTISNLEKKYAQGKNTEERKRNAVLALEALHDDAGNLVDLYAERKKLASLMSDIDAVRDILLKQQDILVTLSAFMKLEERISAKPEEKF